MSVPALRFKEFHDSWTVKKLGAETVWNSGGTPSKQDETFWDGDIPWISASSMRGTRYSNSELKITKAGLAGSKLAKSGDLLLLVRGSMLFNKIPVGIATRDVAFNQDVKSITTKNAITPEFLLNWFSASENQLMNMVSGTGIGAGKLDTQDLLAMDLWIPCAAEQSKIANFLTAVDEKISQLTQKCALLTQYKKGVMQQIFSQELRFKDDEGRGFPEWEEHEVGEIFKVTRGNVLSMTLVTPTPSEQNAYPVFSSQTKNKGLAGYFNSYLYEDSITWTTDGANAGDVNYRKGKFYCTNVCGVLISNEGYANVCVAELINAVSRKFVSYVGNPKLMNNVMAKIRIDFPCVEEQTKIANFLTAIDDKITATQTQLAAVKQYKQGLLQQMFI